MCRLITLFSILLCGSSAIANPGNRDPNALLSPHGLCPAGKELVAKHQALWKQNIDDLNKIISATQQNRIEDVSHQMIFNVGLAGWNIRWYAKQLLEMGEPAGVDMAFRGEHMWMSAHYGMLAYLNTQRGQKLHAAALKALPAGVKKCQKLLQQVIKHVQSGDLEQAEVALMQTENDVWRDAYWLTVAERKPYRDQLDAVTQSFESKLRTQRRAANAGQLKQIAASQNPNVDALALELTAAIGSIQQSGQCQIDGATVSGPEAFARYFEKWQAAHVGLIRCQGIFWALQSIKAASDQGHGPWSQTASNLNAKMLELLPQIILADVSRVNGPQASGLYMQYVSVIAPLAHRTGNAQLFGACNEPLMKFIEKAPEVQQLVGNYRNATDDLLVWRKRLATARTANRKSSYPALASVFATANSSFDQYQGLLDARGRQAIPPTLRMHAPAVLTVSVPKMIDVQITATNLIRLADDGRFTMSNYRDRVYANVPANIDLSSQINALQSDMLVSDSQPPLTLNAAMALDSAKRVDLEAVGGKIAGLYLEGVISRFASFPSIASVLFPLPALPSDGESTETPMQTNQMMMRFDVLPDWVAHEYFVADLTP